MYFLQGFDIYEHPKEITIDMNAAHIWDQSGVIALESKLLENLRMEVQRLKL